MKRRSEGMGWKEGRNKLKPQKATKYDVQHGGWRIEMTAEQEKEFIRLYPVTMNYDMIQMFGMSHSTLYRQAKRLNLKKDMKVIHKKVGRLVRKINIKNGYYESLKGVAPSQQCKDAYQRKLASGWHPLQAMRKNKRRYQAYRQRCSERHKELWAEEKRRKRLGMDWKSTFHMPQFSYTRSQITYRSSAKARGYVLGDIDEQSGERYTIYYNDDTARSEIFERHLSERGFTVKIEE